MNACRNRIAFGLCFALAASLAWPFAAGAGEPALTIYNQDFAVVRDTVPMTLKAGENEVAFTETTAHVETDSVLLRDPSGKVNFRILEQNYRNDPISQSLLLSLYEGKTIDFLVIRDGKEETVSGKIVRSGYTPHYNAMNRYGQQYAMRQMAMSQGTAQPIIEVDGKLRFSMPGQPLFPALADDTVLKPTLHWTIQSPTAGAVDAEIAYITGGMSWKADYNVVIPENSEIADIVGWVTMDNQSGKTFDNARIKLMAGDVSKIQEPGMPQRMYNARASAMDVGGAVVTEKAFDEFHLYTLARPATLRDRETKQIEFVRAKGVKTKRLYVYDGAQIDRNMRHWDANSIRQNKNYGTECNKKVWVMQEIKNSEDNGLGMALPKGRLRFYRQDDDNQLEFIGENEIDHTPKDETIRVYTGNSFDLVGERKQTEYNIDTRRDWLDESFEIKLRNHKKEAVEIRVVEHLYRWINWEITEKSHDFIKTDARTAEFRVTVPADGEVTITYKAHYTW